MIRLVISDVDGTLVPKGESCVPENVKRAVGALISSGCSFAVASGRTYHSLRTLFNDHSDEIYYICCDGAVCVRAGRTLYRRPISEENVRRAFTAARQRGLSLLLSSDMEGYALDLEGGAFEQKLISEKTERFSVVESPFEVKKPIYKLAFYGERDGFGFIPSELRRSYHGGGWSEYVYRYADKGSALADLQARLLIAPRDTAAIGDGENDASMLLKSGHRYALTSALATAVGAEPCPSALHALELATLQRGE